MRFLSTFLWVLHIWQMFSLVPFKLTEKTLLPTANNNYKIFAFFSLWSYISTATCSLIYSEWYIDWSSDPHNVYTIMFNMLSTQAVTCLIIYEAIDKTDEQIDFLERFNKIDNALRYKLKIEINYKSYRLYNNIGCILWFLWHFSCTISIFVYCYLTENRSFERFHIFYAMPFFIYSLQYQRMIVYVHLIRNRYTLLNQFLREFEENVKQNKIDHLTSRDLLIELRNIYQKLYEASDLINKIFRWTLALCIAVDFYNCMGHIFYMFIIFLLNQPWTDAIAPFIWLTCNLGHVLILSHACHSTTKKVIDKNLNFKHSFYLWK